MKKLLITTAVSGFILTGCTASLNPFKTSAPKKTVKHIYEKPSLAKMEHYNNTMGKVAAGIKDDPKYTRITLDTSEKKAWFKNLTYRLWDRQITRDQFISEGIKKYPTHRYEFEFVVKGFSS